MIPLLPFHPHLEQLNAGFDVFDALESAMCGCGSKCLGDVSAFNPINVWVTLQDLQFNTFLSKRSQILTYILPRLSACNNLL